MSKGTLAKLPDGVTYRQLDHWTRQGYLRPVNAATPGTGHARVWPETEVAVAEMIALLRAAGLELAAAARVARVLADGAGVAVLGPGLILWRTRAHTAGKQVLTLSA